MKKLLLIFSFLFTFFIASQAQAPQGLPYQAIVRNASGNILANQSVKLRLSIHDSTAAGVVVYKEVHTITTNAQGLVNVNIGQGVQQVEAFTNINWGKNSKFIQAELDAQNNNTFIDLGTTQLMSVPYALFAEKSPNGLPASGVLGDMLYWNGSQWTPISSGTYGQNLVNCNGIPTWGGCKPIVETNSVSNIFVSFATTGGNITNNGGNSILYSGVCWSTSQNPTLSNFVYNNGSNVYGNFVSYLNALSPNTTYYVRAFASNSAGVTYGNQVSFNTIALSAPAVLTGSVSYKNAMEAVISGNVTDSGTATITSRGICFSTNINPTITNNIMATTTNNIGGYSVELSGLIPLTTYHYRAYATNAVNTSYGADSVFTTAAISIPIVTTTTATSITGSSCVSGGNVSYNGGSAIISRGVCWSTFINPTVELTTKSSDGSSNGSFVSNISELLPNTTYYLRAYATNSVGTAYGSSISFTTNNMPDFISIGNQIWTTKNLNVNHYSNGDVIPQVVNSTVWTQLTTGAWCWYNNDSATYAATYGRLYNWYAVNDPRGLAPQGWHVPSDNEFLTLINYLGTEVVAGGKMKETGTIHWNSPNIDASNSSGFTGLPGGYRSADYATFKDVGRIGLWWSSTDYSTGAAMYPYYLDASNGGIFKNYQSTIYFKNTGLSIRCVKN